MCLAPAETHPDIHPTANIYRSEIGAGTKVAAFVEIGGAKIGARCKIQAFSFVCPGVVLEDEVFVGPHVCFTNDRYPRAVGKWTQEITRVERGAAIGARALIMPGVTIGAGAMVAAGVVVATSVPAGYLYDGMPGKERFKRWYRTQEDVGLPFTFDGWREQYNDLSCVAHQEFYDAVYEKFPEQEHGTLDEARRFFEVGRRESISVLEIGGWDGRLAGELLQNFPEIQRWWNFELCRQAVASGFRNDRYEPRISDEFLWELTEIPNANVFFASHVIEHLSGEHLQRLVSRLESIERVYLEAPLPASASDYSWAGRWNTHILELGWEQVESLFGRHGFSVTHRAPNVRWLERVE